MSVKPLFIGAVAFLFLRGLQKVDAVKNFVYDIIGLPTVVIQGGYAILTFNLLVTNQSGERFDVTQIFSRVLVNGVYVGEVTSMQQFSIPARGSEKIPIQLSLALSNAVSQLIGVLGGSTGSLVLQLSGFIKSRSLTVPISFEKKLK